MPRSAAPEVVLRVCPVEGGEFAARGVEADLEAFDFAEPAVDAGFGNAVGEVLDDLDEAAAGGGVGAEHGAADAPLTELITMFQQFMADFW